MVHRHAVLGLQCELCWYERFSDLGTFQAKATEWHTGRGTWGQSWWEVTIHSILCEWHPLDHKSMQSHCSGPNFLPNVPNDLLNVLPPRLFRQTFPHTVHLHPGHNLCFPSALSLATLDPPCNRPDSTFVREDSRQLLRVLHK